MSRRAIELGGHSRGSALVSALVVFVALLGLVYASVAVSSIEVEESRRTVEGVRTKYLAEAGIERGLGFLADTVAKTDVSGPLLGLKGLFTASGEITPFVAEPLLEGTAQVGAYTVTLRHVEEDATGITVEIEATGYLPDAPTNLAAGEPLRDWDAVSARVRYELGPSEVFDSAYFINNWGWFYGSTLHCNGNARSNGQFDAAGYAPKVTGQPIYESVSFDGSVATLSGYEDDNGDGLADGNDGGVFSGWDIVAAQNVQGNGGLASNQHDFQDPVPMPNLSDLGPYEERALTYGSSISIGGSTVADAVFGDGAGESGNLYLVGTAANPIVLDGPVVVQGDVIISGYVTGQGTIYSGGNVYVPNSIKYLDPPDTTRPSGTTQAETEAWLSANWNKDFLGLFAKENVVVGDHTNSTWRSYVSGWMGSSMNKSEEDAGEDGIPNTKAGKDGIYGTADDDVLEDDNVFTVESYSALDAALGLIPQGYSVGDTIPGSGEDIDGDGQYDSGTTLADIDFSVPLTAANWGGNMPAAGIASYNTVASLYANNLDAVFYTNHSFCYVVLGGTTARINGSLVSRNENIIYGTPTVEMNHDSRLLGGAGGVAGAWLPQVMQPPQILRWQRLTADPHHDVTGATP